MRALAELTVPITTAPWSLSSAARVQAHAAGLTDDDLLQAIGLSALFGHLNRIADVVAVPLDYDVPLPPATDHDAPALAAAAIALTRNPVIETSRRPATAAALGAWRSYVFDRDAPITRRQRTVIARWVAMWLGDGGISGPADLTVNPLDDALRDLSETVTLAPWQLRDASFDRLRRAGFDDAQLFEVCVVASSTGVFSRIAVALAALGVDRS